MKKNTRKILSIILLVSLIVTSNSFVSAAAEVVEAVSAELVRNTEISFTATRSEATKITSKSTPSEAVKTEKIDEEEFSEIIPSEATPSNATPSEATPSNATPSEATPSNATPIEKVEFKYIRPDKSDIPDYYKRVNTSVIFYTFTDRNNTNEYRIYGYYEDESNADWYECNKNGEVDTSCQFIDFDWEYYNLAPYVYHSVGVDDNALNKLKQVLNLNGCDKNLTTSKCGNNYDSTDFDIWKLDFQNINNGTDFLTNNADINMKFLLYGYIVNEKETIDNEYKWFEVSKKGEVFGKLEELNKKNKTKKSNPILEKKMKAKSLVSIVENKKLLALSRSYNISLWGHTRSSKGISDEGSFENIYYRYWGLDHRSDKLYYRIGTKSYYGERTGAIPTIHIEPNEIVAFEWKTRENWHRDRYWLCRGDTIYGERIYSSSCDSDNAIAAFQGLESGVYTTCREEYHENDDGVGKWGAQRKYTVRLEFDKYTTYDVNYNGNGADGGTTAATHHSTGTNSHLAYSGFSKKYHVFNSWNAKPDGTSYSYLNGQVVASMPLTSSNITLYAIWRRVSSLVTFKDFDGRVLKYQEVSIGGNATAPSNPTRLGYTFTGWSRSVNNITDHTNITANYRANTYTVVYNGNGASGGSTVASLHSYDSVKKLTANGFSNKYYTFKNWNTKADGTGTTFSNVQNIINITSKNGGTITLYAQWTRSSSLVIFEDWNGSTLGEQEVNMGGTAIAPSPDRIGYTFLGWDKSLSNITDHTIITAQYIIKFYNFQLIANGGTIYGNTSKEETVSYNLSFDQLLLNGKTHASRVGYTFKGWYTLSIGGNSYSYTGNRMPASDLVVYAQWEPNKYHIRLLGNHYSSKPIILEFDKFYNTKLGTLPEPEVPGYTFLGWFDTDGKEATSESWVEPCDVDYNAQWDANKYTIHFDKNIYAIDEDPENKTVTYDSYLGELPVLNTEGYTFMGWYTEPERGERVDEKTSVALGDQTYYAHWINKAYSLKFITENAFNIIKNVKVIYDVTVGVLPNPKLEDFKFRGWYFQPYSDKKATPSEAVSNYREGILQDTATPSEALRIEEGTVYKKATASEAYAYFNLVFREESGNINRRCGRDGEMDTDDDNFYFNGQDGIAGSSDDCKIEKGEDKIYGTGDDYYVYKGYRVFPGQGKIFGDLDDYMDLEDGTNLRSGVTSKWIDTENILVHNGYDEKPGTMDDWIWESKDLNIIRKSGPDGIFFTEDDELWSNGKDKIPGNEDDKLIYKGLDGEYGTEDDFIDNGDGTNTRAGADKTWGTEDDELWSDGEDKIPGNEDDKLIHKGSDGKYGTDDDFIDNGDGTNTRAGADKTWGTEDDEFWSDGEDKIPGNEDDKLIHKGLDGVYGTDDDFIDNGDGTNTRAGADKTWGTEDDKLWSNGEDGIPGNEDDKSIGSETSTSSETVPTEQFTKTVIPMDTGIVDDDDDNEIVDHSIIQQTSALKQSNYEGLSGVWDDFSSFIPKASKETYKKNKIGTQLSVKAANNSKTTFWNKLYNWFKEARKDVLAVLLLFLGGLVVLFEVSRKKQFKAKLFKAKLLKAKQFKTKPSSINKSNVRRYNDRKLYHRNSGNQH